MFYVILDSTKLLNVTGEQLDIFSRCLRKIFLQTLGKLLQHELKHERAKQGQGRQQVQEIKDPTQERMEENS